MKTYLEPLKKETFLSNTEINALFGNIQEIFGFQQQFLQTLENALETEAQFYNLDTPSQFKVCINLSKEFDKQNFYRFCP